MARPRPEPVQVVKQRRDAALNALVAGVPYMRFLGVTVERRGDELTAILPFAERLIGNPTLPAIHGGVTAAFMEVTAQIEVSWAMLWDDLEGGRIDPETLGPDTLPRLPKTIDFTVDYLRSGLPRDAYARARVTRAGRRYSTVQVEAWQDNRARPFAQATAHFLMPRRDGAAGG
ncbi:thioesterase superfamily protein [Dinoroseobacter shibae DFL 12 = DSM 16493]|jgi:acyl-coenzyme A thioesterase PaaI-like protein|uniref:Thioesterase superfamily protein n=1 Tax=Dinoroseobacter shibae (strain DSM 16493 / NCIMB 14021 / DFL 12) TaxID=398580 RepID=A8LRD9_DINSH|nr:PaaI family thioesterase [Dinoroseobacter shibae]ABV92589.1 thioesterase superfamily protein [Dinoroseobacter shibae DFL 12 = DSM 16493]URF47533.1 PaaI family thioesterase [Dinoroseobacter shibae]URF51844.1 PaaI family thioesterase [Dinoroseobacter shibae]